MVTSTVFEQPHQLPVRSLDVTGPVLVVAPHPDDETLGCGGAIAQLRAQGVAVYILVVSDGTQSHPNSRQYPAPALRQLRESETLAAMALLGVPKNAVTFLGLPDGAIPPLHSDAATSALDRCQACITGISPKTIFLPYRHDPHPDHRASWQLMRRAAMALPHQPRLIEYPVWDWDPAQRGNLPTGYYPWRLDVSAHQVAKRAAVACYCSQITDLISDDPSGFRFTGQMLAHFTQPWELYFDPPTSAPDQSLGTEYFESLYQTDPDPWGFETSTYEAVKYAATLAALPQPRYRNAFEIGGSIGVLTAQLAARCAALLSIDISPTAQAQAVQRCRHLPQVRFELMNVPQRYPDQTFDLVLLSEVGYYWCWEDLARSQQLIYDSLELGGTLILVHWTGEVPDYPLDGDTVHNAFAEFAHGRLRHCSAQRTERYRLDVYERLG